MARESLGYWIETRFGARSMDGLNMRSTFFELVQIYKLTS